MDTASQPVPASAAEMEGEEEHQEAGDAGAGEEEEGGLEENEAGRGADMGEDADEEDGDDAVGGEEEGGGQEGLEGAEGGVQGEGEMVVDREDDDEEEDDGEEEDDEGEEMEEGENGSYEGVENIPPPPVSAVYMVDQGGVGQEVMGPVPGVLGGEEAGDEGADGDEEEEEEEEEMGEAGVGEEGARRWTVQGSGPSPLGFNEFSDPNHQQQSAAMAGVEEGGRDNGTASAVGGSVVPTAPQVEPPKLNTGRRWYRQERVLVHPPEESLDFVGENRIVFVGDFDITLSNNLLTRNNRLHSHTVTDRRGWEWRLMLIPNGNSADSVGHLSVFVEHVNKDEIRNMEPGFSRDMRLGFALLPVDPSRVRTSDTLNKIPLRHTFNYKNADFGYPRCWLRSEVYYRKPGDVYATENGVVRIATFLEDAKDTKVPPGHNSKLETGMVGLKNQGATCYMNSLLQTLFHVPSLRKAVYDMPTGGENSVTSMALALQRVFYRLQTSDKSVGTKELTKSFGWDAYDSFTQQDVQELNRVLCDHLEDKMKGTPVEGTIQRLFEGSIRSYIKCVDVDFTSSRVETYYDIQLDVKGCRDIHESFSKYVEEELLDGDNKYDAGEELGRQDAKKGVRFLQFPPVLTIHLKRFEYDMATGNMVKVNDRFMFPKEMNIDQYLDEEAERDPDRPNHYILHSILVHSGDVHGGHYFAYIRPNGTDWCKFNDDVVTQVDETEAIEGSYGAGPDILEEKYRDSRTFFPRVDVPPRVGSEVGGVGGIGRGWWAGGDNTSAYMLVYVRECDLGKTMINLDAAMGNGIPRRLRDRFQREEEEYQRKVVERNEAHLYYNLRVARDCDIGGVRVFLQEEFVKWDNTLTVKVKKRAPAEGMTRVVARAIGIRPDRCRLWFCCSRENKTIRPESAFQGPFDNITVQDVCMDTGPPKTLGGQESYSVFVDEVGKYESIEEEVIKPEQQQKEDGKVSGPGSEEAKKGTDTKRLRLDRASTKQEALGEGGNGKGEGVEEGGVDGVVDQPEDEDSQVEAVRRGDAYPTVTSSNVLVFFKYYQPEVKPMPTMTYVGHAMLAGGDSSERIAEESVRLAGLPPDTAIDLYEQVTPRSVNHLPQDKTLSENELQHGDIILFQRRQPPASAEVKSEEGSMELVKEEQDSDQAGGATEETGAVGGGDAAAPPAAATPGGEQHRKVAGEGGGEALQSWESGKSEVHTKQRMWTGLAGAERVLVDGVWLVVGGTETAKSFMELRSSKRVVHFTGRSAREGVLFPEGSSTQDGRSPGVTVELPRTASHREILETLCNRLEMVDGPLLLRVSAMNVGGKPQTYPTRVHLSDLDLPQHALHKILEAGGGSYHSHTLVFELAPFPLNELTHSATLVEAYSTDAILKRHCLARMEDHPVIKLARRRTRARREVAEARAVGGAVDAEEGENGHGLVSKKRKLGEGSQDEIPPVNGHNGSSNSTTSPSTSTSTGTVSNGCDLDTNDYPTCEDVVLAPPGPEELIATYVLVKGQRTIQDILRQLSRELRLPHGSEHRLRLLGMGNGEITAVIDKHDDAQRFFMAKSVAQNVYNPIIKDLPMGSIILEYADDEELKSTCCWGKEPPPPGEPAPPAWMPLQVVLFTVNAQGKWTVLHGNPMVTFVKATDEVEDVIERYGRRRGTAALEAAGLRRGRPAVIENFKPTYIDEERDKDHGVRTTVYSCSRSAAAPGGAVGADGAAGGNSHQSNGIVGNGAAGVSGDGDESGFRSSLLWMLLCERFPHYVNKGMEDEPMPSGRFPTLGFKKDNPNEPRSFYRRAEQGIRIRGS